MHASEHVIAAIMRALRVGDGIVARRRFRQSGDSGDFAERQLMDVLAEIDQRCRSDTVGAFPEKDLVEIQLKDFLLRQFIFDAQREQNFLELAGEGALVAEEHIARRSEEHKSELQSLMRISYAAFCFNNK